MSSIRTLRSAQEPCCFAIRRITQRNKEYPKLLKEIYKPPALYIRGEFKPSDEFSLAVVGTRRLTSYGQQVAPQIVYDLAKAGLTIVSGLAVGIDTLAHQAALEAKGRTIAVLGSGIDDKSIYPFCNKKLAQKIIQSGALISEFEPGTPPLAQHFPSRNRIISGLSLGVLVIEAGFRSGALITARCALDQDREVFAIPGSIFSEKSQGPNNLIKMGAKMVIEANDILEELNLSQTIEFIETKKIVPETVEEAKILKLLSHEPIHIDQLTKQVNLNVSQVNSAIIMMEMKGMIRNLGGMNYVLAR